MGKLLALLFLAFCTFALVDCGGGNDLMMTAEVIDRTYVPAHTSWGTDSKGRLTSQHTSDDYKIIVRHPTEGIVKVDTDAEGYYLVKSGQQLRYEVTEGCISHYFWYPHYKGSWR